MQFRALSRFALIGFVFVSLGVLGEGESERRIGTGIRLAKKIMAEQPKISRASLTARVRRAMQEEFPVLRKAPSVPVITEVESLRDYTKRFEEILDKRHPVLSDYQLSLLAAQRYPLYSRGDYVTVYYVRGNRVETWKGRLIAIEDGRITVGSRRIFFSDMENVEGNDVELLKYLPEENAVKREAYKEQLRKQIDQEREAFRLNQHREVEAEILAQDGKKNEAHGYTCHNRSWLTPEKLIDLVVQEALTEAEDAHYEVLNATMKGRRQILNALEWVQDLHYAYDVPGRLETPLLAELRGYEARMEQERLALIARREKEAREAAEAARLAAEEKARIVAQKKREAALKAAMEKAAYEAKLAAEREAAEKEAARIAEEKRAAEAKLAARRARKAKLMEEERRLRQMRADKYYPVFVGGVVFAIVFGLGLALFLHGKKKREADPFSKFFEGKGKLQRDFWAQATADPEHFKYVAYMFPNLEEASKALGRLSYMHMGSGGSLHCSRDLQFGVYPHLNGAVCFVGGVKFSYALWREASAVLPELPKAQYFKVSTEPMVQLILPDLDKLSEDKHMNVESLGVEEHEGENGEFNRLYRYRAVSREEAEAFLENFNIHEAGIIVHVELPDGILGKDENGVFTLEKDVLENKD